MGECLEQMLVRLLPGPRVYVGKRMLDHDFQVEIPVKPPNAAVKCSTHHSPWKKPRLHEDVLTVGNMLPPLQTVTIKIHASLALIWHPLGRRSVLLDCGTPEERTDSGHLVKSWLHSPALQ